MYPHPFRPICSDQLIHRRQYSPPHRPALYIAGIEQGIGFHSRLYRCVGAVQLN